MPTHHLTVLTLGLAVLFTIVTFGQLIGSFGTTIATPIAILFVTFPSLCLALILARLAALDLTTHTLPDIYAIPLVSMGLAHSFSTGQGANLAILPLLGALTFIPRLQLGGGDLKLMAAMFLFLGFQFGFWAIALGCILWLPMACWRPHHPQPFGVPIALGWLGCSLFA